MAKTSLTCQHCNEYTIRVKIYSDYNIPHEFVEDITNVLYRFVDSWDWHHDITIKLDNKLVSTGKSNDTVQFTIQENNKKGVVKRWQYN